jgi:Predicted periplasmic protein (DUF2271)
MKFGNSLFLMFSIAVLLMPSCILGNVPEDVDVFNNGNNGTTNNVNQNNITTNNNNTSNNNNELVNGTLTISTTTVSYNGQFAPEHCAAVWIQKPDGEYVSTLMVAEQYYGVYLTQWISVAHWDKTDAVTSASRFSHGPMSATWNIVDVEPGEYEFWVEQTEDNGSGKWTHGTIDLDGSAKTVQGLSTSEFINLQAEFTN